MIVNPLQVREEQRMREELSEIREKRERVDLKVKRAHELLKLKDETLAALFRVSLKHVGVYVWKLGFQKACFHMTNKPKSGQDASENKTSKLCIRVGGKRIGPGLGLHVN